MVNENKGKVYEPVAVYDRKLLRSIMRNKLEKENGYGANKKLSTVFHEYQNDKLRKGEKA